MVVFILDEGVVAGIAVLRVDFRDVILHSWFFVFSIFGNRIDSKIIMDTVLQIDTVQLIPVPLYTCVPSFGFAGAESIFWMTLTSCKLCWVGLVHVRVAFPLFPSSFKPLTGFGTSEGVALAIAPVASSWNLFWLLYAKPRAK